MRRLSILLLALLPAVAHADWPIDGARVCAAPRDQVVPTLCSDGQQGAFIVWGDYRESYSHTDVYLHHLTGAGVVAPGWPLDGLLLAGGPSMQFPQGLVPDGAGGVLVLIRNQFVGDAGDLYLQRITAGGQIAPGWPAGGAPVAVAPGEQSFATMASDGAGGAWVSWYVYRSDGHADGYLTHILGDGTLAPGWPVNGRAHEPGTGFSGRRPVLLADGDGGVLACWNVVSDVDLSSSWMLAMHYDAAGVAAAEWPEGGLLVCTEGPGNRLPRGIVSDGAGGFYIAWDDLGNRGWPYGDIYAQHVTANGTLATGWPAGALPVSALPGVDQLYPSLCEDTFGGMYVGWLDDRAGFDQVFIQHLLPDGQPWPGWPADGLQVGPALTWQTPPHVVADGSGGVYVVWDDIAGNYRTFVQHLTAFGVPQAGWPVNGVAVAATPRSQYRPAICSDGAGGAIVAWEDCRELSSCPDIYAQRFVRDGIVAASVSLVSAEATPAEARLVWAVSGARSASVERRGDAAAWEARATLEADGEGRIEFTDTAVVPGTAYEYRLAFADGTHGGLATVEVPLAFALALEGARPNPARGVLQVALTLPDGAPAQLALYDLSGRRIASREVGAHGPGRHVVRLDDGALAPGLYWVTLTHGGRTLRARVAVVR